MYNNNRDDDKIDEENKFIQSNRVVGDSSSSSGGSSNGGSGRDISSTSLLKNDQDYNLSEDDDDDDIDNIEKKPLIIESTSSSSTSNTATATPQQQHTPLYVYEDDSIYDAMNSSNNNLGLGSSINNEILNQKNGSKKKLLLFQIYSTVLAILYLSTSALLPLLSKQIFIIYDYPLTSSLLQTVGASFILLVFNIIQYYHHKDDLLPKSYITDRNFVSKAVLMLPVSICFAIVISLTNIGISMVPVNFHVIFKSTNIIWVVIFSFIVHREKPTIPILISISFLMAGTIMVSLVFSGQQSSSFVPIFINLLSSFFESVTLVVLKWSCQYMYRKDETISVVEITFFKCAEGSLVILLPLLAIEHVKGFITLAHLPFTTILLVIAGVFVTIIFQATTVGLIKSLYVITVGTVTQLQIIPQILLSVVWFHSFVISALHISGVTLSIFGCLIFTLHNFYLIYKQKKEYSVLQQQQQQQQQYEQDQITTIN